MSTPRPITLGDEVKSLVSQEPVSGKVLAIYPMIIGSTTMYLDVRSTEDKIYYATPAANWETTIPVEDLE